MKAGMDLQELANAINTTYELTSDLLVPEGKITMVETVAEASDIRTTAQIQEQSASPRLRFAIPSTHNSHGDVVHEARTIKISELAHQQLATHLRIPKTYYDRMAFNSPDLLCVNANQWLKQDSEGKPKRMLRTLDPDKSSSSQISRALEGFDTLRPDSLCRAFLSERYRPMDNYSLAQHVLPLFQENEWEVKSANLSNKFLDIKAIRTGADYGTREVKVGDPVAIGVHIRNSEVGCASLSISPFIERLICTNGMSIPDFGPAHKRRHLGARQDEISEVNDLVTRYKTDETRQAHDRYMWLNIKDTIRACSNETTFTNIISRIQEADQNHINKDVTEVIEEVGKRLVWQNEDRRNILDHLIHGGDITQWGLANAATRYSQDVEDYGRATDFEADGWSIVKMDHKIFNA